MTAPREKMTTNYVKDFLEAVYPGNAELVASSFNEKATLEDATALIGKLKAEVESLRGLVIRLDEGKKKAEAELVLEKMLTADLTRDVNEAEAELERARPLLEAAGVFTEDDKQRIGNALDNIPYYTPISDYKCPGKVLRDKFKALLAVMLSKEKE